MRHIVPGIVNLAFGLYTGQLRTGSTLRVTRERITVIRLVADASTKLIEHIARKDPLRLLITGSRLLMNQCL